MALCHFNPTNSFSISLTILHVILMAFSPRRHRKKEKKDIRNSHVSQAQEEYKIITIQSTLN